MRRTLLLTALVVLPAVAAAQGKAEPAKTPPPAAKVEPAKPEAKAEATNWGAKVKAGTTIYATFQTSMGDLTIKLLTKEAPRTVENFVTLAAGEKEWLDPRNNQKTRKPLYDGTVFHRVIPNFMIQGGDPLGQGIGGPGYKFEDEFQSGKTFDKPCLLAMANSGPNTNGSQFFITEVNTPHLNGKHTIFGETVKGCDLVAKIARNKGEQVQLKKLVLSEKP